jgi:DNA-binding transcriptional LysR family regulator
MISGMFDPILLKTFVAVAKSRSFTRAGVQLGLGQPTVSQHIQRLEVVAGRRLMIRDTHSVTLTPDGEAMLGFAYAILDANERARRYLTGSKLSGKLRFGASEDFVATRLPDVLREFATRHPAVELELTVALSGVLYELLDAGELDLVLAKRRVGLEQQREARSGIVVWSERLVWAARDAGIVEDGRPVPLVVFPRPSVTRAAALEALDRVGVAWRISCTSGSLSGLRAAALAGLGVIVQPRSMVPAGLTILPVGKHLPELDAVEFILTGVGNERDSIAAQLVTEILDNNVRLDLTPLIEPKRHASAS